MKPIVRVLVIGWVLVAFLWSCRSSQHVMGSLEKPSPVSDTVDYTLIYLVHGDAGYLYHDEEGQGRQADEQVVKKAKSIGRKAKRGEVLIFHQRPEKKIFWLFPQKDRRFYHFKNGKLVNQQKYSPQSSEASFSAEAKYFKKYRSKASQRQFLLYFGHEIPDQNIGYHQSQKHTDFNIHTFSEGVGSFLNNENLFDLTILSTCDNGTPQMASTMASYSNALLASPKNLHLSHIDTDSLLKLEKNPDIPELELAQTVAEDTYQRLNSFIQTSVTLSIFDLQQESDKIGSLKEAYSNYKDSSDVSIEAENIDCKKLPFWDILSTPKVDKIFYKPPRFGQKSMNKSFSGWGCEE